MMYSFMHGHINRCQQYLICNVLLSAYDLSRFCLTCIDTLIFLIPRTFKLFNVPTFYFEPTWWRLFQKRVVHTKWYIYVFITITDFMLLHPHSSYCVITEPRDKYPCFDLIKEEFEDTKGVIRIRKSKKNRKHNG